MKYILHIIAKLYIGGAEKVARDIAMFAPLDYENHFVVFGDEVGDYEQELLNINCKIFHIPYPSESYPNFVENLKKLMREVSYQAVHAHTMFNAGWVMLAAKQMKVPVRVAHAHSALDHGDGVKVKAYEALMRRMILANATDLVGCGVDAGNRLFGEKEFSRRGKLILNGVDTALYAFQPEMRELVRGRLGLTDKFVIGHAGHMIPVKNQSFLIERMPEILKRRKNAVLFLLGDGEDRKKLEETAEGLGLRDKVIMTGNVTNVSDLLNAMDVFAFPSLYEGMPLSILEVQANGLPCILSDRVPEDVFVTDLLTPLPLDNTDAWVSAICKAKRGNSEQYEALVRDSGLEIRSAVKKFYEIYEQ